MAFSCYLIPEIN